MKIAILSTEYLKDYLEEGLQALELDCETEIFIYYNYVHIVDLYRQLEGRFDGFITTGPGPMQSIKKSIPDCKPLSYFFCSDSNYYKTFFEVIYRYQDWNFEHGYFDFCDYLCPDQESSLIQYLKDGNLSDWLEENSRYMSAMSLEDTQTATQKKLEKHIRLWNEGKIKYSLSRMSPIMPQILEAGVPCYYISFSVDDMRTCFKQLTQEILVNQLRDNQPAAIDVLLPTSDLPEQDSIKAYQDRFDFLERLVAAFGKKYLCDFVAHKIHMGLRISTNHRTVETITKGFTTSSLRDYIKQNGKFQVYVGYGMGEDLTQAAAAAADAAREARINLGQASYLINENRDLIRLSGEGIDLAIQGDDSLYVREVADRSGLSTLTIQKLIAALKITGTEEVTTQDLARILHITVRSANRFVTALVKCNLAKVLYAKQTNTKGRPSKVYQILLETE